MEANFNLVTPKYISEQIGSGCSFLQKELLEKAVAALIFPAALREVSINSKLFAVL